MSICLPDRSYCKTHCRGCHYDDVDSRYCRCTTHKQILDALGYLSPADAVALVVFITQSANYTCAKLLTRCALRARPTPRPLATHGVLATFTMGTSRFHSRMNSLFQYLLTMEFLLQYILRMRWRYA